MLLGGDCSLSATGSAASGLDRLRMLLRFAGSTAVLLSAIPFSWAAATTYLNGRHAKHTGTLLGQIWLRKMAQT